jgi:hypothetical protein
MGFVLDNVERAHFFSASVSAEDYYSTNCSIFIDFPIIDAM